MVPGGFRIGLSGIFIPWFWLQRNSLLALSLLRERITYRVAPIDTTAARVPTSTVDGITMFFKAPRFPDWILSGFQVDDQENLVHCIFLL